MTKAYDIVAYTYKADILCPGCTLRAVTPPCFDPNPGVEVEEVLDAIATSRSIDRYDEHTFDSDDFPKVVFASQVEDVEHCGSCGGEL